MGRIGPNEVRGGPNRVSAQRRRRLCRALRGALCGGLREGVRGYAGVCGGVECVGTGRVAGRLRRGVLWREVLRREGYRDGGRTGRSGGRGGGTKRCAGGGCGELRMASCGTAAGLLRKAGRFGEGILRGRNAWGLPVLLRYGAADGCGGVDRKAGFLSPGRAIGMESRRGTAAERAVVMKGGAGVDVEAVGSRQRG